MCHVSPAKVSRVGSGHHVTRNTYHVPRPTKMLISTSWAHKREAHVCFDGFEIAVLVGSKDSEAAQILMSAIQEVVMTKGLNLFPPQVAPPCLGCGGHTTNDP